MIKYTSFFLLLCLSGLLSTSSDAHATSRQDRNRLTIESVPSQFGSFNYVADQFIVKRNQCAFEEWEDFLENYSAEVVHSFGDFYVVEIASASGATVVDLLRVLRSEQCVEKVVPNALFRASNYVPTDPLFANQWYMHDGEDPSPDLDLPQAWSIQRGQEMTGGNGVLIGMFDTGLPYYLYCPDPPHHPDFDPERIEVCYDWYTNFQYHGDGRDVHGHGTLVGGIIGASDNESGIVGINHFSKIAIIRALEDLDAAPILGWILEGSVQFMRPDYHPNAKKIANFSWGFTLFETLEEDRYLMRLFEEEIIARFYEYDVLVVCASGNHRPLHGVYPVDTPGIFAGFGFDPSWEGGYDNVICVAGHQRDGTV